MEDYGIFVAIMSTYVGTLQPNGIFYGHLVRIDVIWYIFPVLVCFSEKNLATLFRPRNELHVPKKHCLPCSLQGGEQRSFVDNQITNCQNVDIQIVDTKM
jgi:hypothetical protein